jgi:hypothetical protein
MIDRCAIKARAVHECDAWCTAMLFFCPQGDRINRLAGRQADRALSAAVGGKRDLLVFAMRREP